MLIYLSLLVCFIGALVYGISENPKVAELGRCAFWTGLLAFLLTFPKIIETLR
jgi:Na+/phosphate symporter